MDFAVDPGLELLDWISPNPAVCAAVFLRAAAPVGYVRYPCSQPQRPGVFLAADHRTAREMARIMLGKAGGEMPAPELSLPLHPATASAAAFGIPICRAWEAAMALSLGPSPLEEYLAQVRAGARPPGRVVWPVEFDLA